jgi:hypothetical protein
MSSTYNIIAPQIAQLGNALTASYLLGNAQTDTISITANNPYGGVIKFNNNIRVPNMYGTASYATNLAPQTYYITASNAISAISSAFSSTTNYLNYSAGQNNGTASYAITAQSVVNGVGPTFFSTASLVVSGAYANISSATAITLNGVPATAKTAILQIQVLSNYQDRYLTFIFSPTQSGGALGAFQIPFLYNTSNYSTLEVYTQFLIPISIIGGVPTIYYTVSGAGDSSNSMYNIALHGYY